ncbi:UPF0481 protein [Artemisia annua]|uniref:UPF0481 protein n=1 Tax=Artemisia annua TaxID=35608 RepID=A0A2U1M6L1_ARTAN|nr:UPF0481 protein [Artemisia annua]
MAYYKNSTKRHWVEQISTSIKTKPSTVDDSEFNSKEKNKLCIVAVPKCFFKENPEAYKPQKLGLGPYHHFRAEVYQMEWEKVAAVKASLNEEQINNFDVLVVDKLKDLYVSIQEHYGNFFDMDVNTFAWMFAIDGLFLLMQLYHMQKEFVSDIMMLENQIPFEVLKALQTYVSSVKDNEDDGLLSNKLVRFCEAVSPLELAKESQIRGGASCQLHLLDLLYELIVNKVAKEQGNHELLSRKKKVACINDIKASVRERFPSCFSCRSLLGQIRFMTSTVFGAAWHMFSRKEEDLAEDEKINAQEIRIPSVSLLHDVMNVEFKVAQGGISIIEFNKEHLIFYLPTIIVKENTEVILRNLVAYEATRVKSYDILQFAEYVDLMCGIIDKPRDVELLRKRNILKVQDDMDDEEIANLFNGIKKSTSDRKRQHGLDKAVAKVNERFLNSTQVKVYRFMQKYVYNSWKFLTFSATVLILIFTGFQSFCDVYGCSDHFFAE